MWNSNLRRNLETEIVLATILINFGYLENSPRYDIDICVVFDQVYRDEFESEGKIGNGSSFVRQFGEKPTKTAENHQKSVHFSWTWGPLELGWASPMPPTRRSDSEYAECCWGCKMCLYTVSVTSCFTCVFVQFTWHKSDVDLSQFRMLTTWLFSCLILIHGWKKEISILAQERVWPQQQ